MMSPFKGPVVTQEQYTFNQAMSKIREPVEWIFKEVAQQFTFIDFSRSQKNLLSPCGLFYLVSLLLCNAHTTLHHPQTPQYFACPPPTLKEYFIGGPIDDSQLDAWCLDSMWEEIEVEDNGEEDNEENMEEA
jgi:hypothetical protein